MSEIDPQEFGRLQAEVSSLRRDNDRMLDLLEKLTEKIDSIEQKLSEAKGGWRVLMLIGGASAAVGGLATAAMGHLVTFFGRGAP